MFHSLRSGSRSWTAAACLVVVAQAGCTSALTTAYLRDGVWGGADHAEAAVEGSEHEAEPAASLAAGGHAPDGPADEERRAAALEEAMSRLSRLGVLDPAVEAALVDTLQKTQPEDWPVVVEEFAASLPPPPVAAAPTSQVVSTAKPPAPAEAAEPVVAPVTEPAVVASQEPPAPATPEPAPAADPPAPAVDPPPASVAAVAPPALAVRRACFASAVRAWGELDRFAADRFRPGQELIVYVELDNLAAGESPAGHTTCIDAVLRLVDDAGRTLHTWTFDPVAETCAARRRDYFARYVVRIPDAAPAGGCRVNVVVTDTLAGATAEAALPLEIAVAE